MNAVTGRQHTVLSARVIRADGTVEDLGIVAIDGKPATRARKFLHTIRTLKERIYHGNR